MTLPLSGRELAILEKQAAAQERLALAIKSGAGKEFRTERLAYDKSKSEAEEAIAEAVEREAAAVKATAQANIAGQNLADKTTKEHAALAERESEVAEREQAADERETAQEERDGELARREDLLRRAGVKDI